MRRALVTTLVIALGWVGCGDDGAGPDETVSTPLRPSGPEWLLWKSPSATYTTDDAVSSLGHPVIYRFDWGDNNTSGWGEGVRVAQWSWDSQPRVFSIRAQARCGLHLNVISAWSPPLKVTIEHVESRPPETWIVQCPDSIIDYSTFVVEWDGLDNATVSNKLLFSHFLAGKDADWSPFGFDRGRALIGLPNGSYTFSVRAMDESGNVDPSPAVCHFSIELAPQCSVNVTRPWGAEVLPDSTEQTIEWSYSGSMMLVNVDLYRTGQFVAPIARSEFNDGAIDWFVSSESFGVGGGYRLEVVNVDDPSCFGWSGEFSIETKVTP